MLYDLNERNAVKKKKKKKVISRTKKKEREGNLVGDCWCVKINSMGNLPLRYLTELFD